MWILSKLLICLIIKISEYNFYSYFFIMAIKKHEFDLHQHSFEWAGKQMSIETGKLAMQAGSSIRLQQ
jgi:hypothetical protein